MDERGKVPGRGAYLCHRLSCWQTALQSNMLPRALATELSAEDWQRIEQYAQSNKRLSERDALAVMNR